MADDNIGKAEVSEKLSDEEREKQSNIRYKKKNSTPEAMYKDYCSVIDAHNLFPKEESPAFVSISKGSFESFAALPLSTQQLEIDSVRRKVINLRNISSRKYRELVSETGYPTGSKSLIDYAYDSSLERKKLEIREDSGAKLNTSKITDKLTGLDDRAKSKLSPIANKLGSRQGSNQRNFVGSGVNFDNNTFDSKYQEYCNLVGSYAKICKEKNKSQLVKLPKKSFKSIPAIDLRIKEIKNKIFSISGKKTDEIKSADEKVGGYVGSKTQARVGRALGVAEMGQKAAWIGNKGQQLANNRAINTLKKTQLADEGSREVRAMRQKGENLKQRGNLIRRGGTVINTLQSANADPAKVAADLLKSEIQNRITQAVVSTVANAVAAVTSALAPIIAPLALGIFVLIGIFGFVVVAYCAPIKIARDMFEAGFAAGETAIDVAKEGALMATDNVLDRAGKVLNGSYKSEFRKILEAYGCKDADDNCGGSGAFVNTKEWGSSNGKVSDSQCQRLKKYAPYIKEASSMYGIPVEFIAGFMSHETFVGELLTGKSSEDACDGYGDGGYGHGIGQIDGDSWFATQGTNFPAGTPTKMKDKNGKTLIWSDCRDGIVFIGAFMEQSIKSFTPKLEAQGVKAGSKEYWRQIANSYNAGRICTVGTDDCTTSKDYGSDILGRSADVMAKGCLGGVSTSDIPNTLQEVMAFATQKDFFEVKVRALDEKDKYALATMVILEAGPGTTREAKLSQLDVTQILINRAKNKYTPSANGSLYGEIYAEGQFAAMFPFPNVKDEASAIAAIEKKKGSGAKQMLSDYFATLQDSALVTDSAKFIGTKVNFRSYDTQGSVRRPWNKNAFFEFEDGRSATAGNISDYVSGAGTTSGLSSSNVNPCDCGNNTASSGSELTSESVVRHNGKFKDDGTTKPQNWSDITKEHADFMHNQLGIKYALVKEETSLEDLGNGQKMEKTAAAAFKEMAKGNSGVVAVSGFRSYDEQVGTFFKSDGDNAITKYFKSGMTEAEKKEVANGYRARAKWSLPPATSQHHSGKAVDIGSTDASFKETKAYNYLKIDANGDEKPDGGAAKNFGFKEWYDKQSGNENNVGPEPWHWYFEGKKTSYAVPVSPDFGKLSFGEIVVKAQNPTDVRPGESGPNRQPSVAEMRKKLKELFDKDIITQVGGVQQSDSGGYISGFDDSMIIYMYSLYENGIVWVGGPKNYNRDAGSTHAGGSSYDFWGFAYRDQIESGGGIKGFDGPIEMFDFNYPHMQIPEPKRNGNQKDPRVYRIADLTVKDLNSDVKSKILDLFGKAAKLLDLSGGYNQIATHDGSLDTIKANISKENSSDGGLVGHTAGRQSPDGTNGHNNHMHVTVNNKVKFLPAGTVTNGNIVSKNCPGGNGTVGGGVLTKDGWTNPLPGGVYTSPFGPRWGRQHKGMDIANNGTVVVAAKDGTVIYTADGCTDGDTDCGGQYGNIVHVDHGGGVTSEYNHLANGTIKVRKGQSVKAGTPLGTEGKTGFSTAIHLHFNVLKDGVHIDPCTVLNCPAKPDGDAYNKMP